MLCPSLHARAAALLLICSSFVSLASGLPSRPHLDARSNQRRATSAALPVDLGVGQNFVILASSQVTTVPNSHIVGDVGISPIDHTAATGFSLVLDPSGSSATSSQISGRFLAADFGGSTSTLLTTAVLDVYTAYTSVANQGPPDYLEMGGGQLDNVALTPGIYKWSTGVNIVSNIDLVGPCDSVFVFQISGILTQAALSQVNLIGGVLASRVYWQVTGGVLIGADATFNGIILSATDVLLDTGASMTGRIFSGTAAILNMASIYTPQPFNPAYCAVSTVTQTLPPLPAATQFVTLPPTTSTETITQLSNPFTVLALAVTVTATPAPVTLPPSTATATVTTTEAPLQVFRPVQISTMSGSAVPTTTTETATRTATQTVTAVPMALTILVPVTFTALGSTYTTVQYVTMTTTAVGPVQTNLVTRVDTLLVPSVATILVPTTLVRLATITNTAIPVQQTIVETDVRTFFTTAFAPAVTSIRTTTVQSFDTIITTVTLPGSATVMTLPPITTTMVTRETVTQNQFTTLIQNLTTTTTQQQVTTVTLPGSTTISTLLIPGVDRTLFQTVTLPGTTQVSTSFSTILSERILFATLTTPQLTTVLIPTTLVSLQTTYVPRPTTVFNYEYGTITATATLIQATPTTMVQSASDATSNAISVSMKGTAIAAGIGHDLQTARADPGANSTASATGTVPTTLAAIAPGTGNGGGNGNGNGNGNGSGNGNGGHVVGNSRLSSAPSQPTTFYAGTTTVHHTTTITAPFPFASIFSITTSPSFPSPTNSASTSSCTGSMAQFALIAAAQAASAAWNEAASMCPNPFADNALFNEVNLIAQTDGASSGAGIVRIGARVLVLASMGSLLVFLL